MGYFHEEAKMLDYFQDVELPYRFAINVAHKRVEILLTPTLNDHDALECIREVRYDPEFRADLGILINVLAAKRPLYPTEAQHLAALMKLYFQGQRIAFLQFSLVPDQTFDALRAAASLKTNVRIFSKRRAAEAWLAS